jgi:hypothetical protein
MNRIDEYLWPAPQPPRGFADATVERILAETPVARATPRRWVGPLGVAMAALFISGAAFGWGVRVSRSSTQQTFHAAVLRKSEPVAMRRLVLPIVRPSAPRAIAAPAAHMTKVAVPPASKPEPLPALNVPSTELKIPACQCERGFSDVICDCY